MTQPLIVSRSKVKDLFAGAAEIVYLIPELCRVTGLTSDMRTNFQLMKSINVHTQVGPKERINKLVSFSHRLMGQTEVCLTILFVVENNNCYDYYYYYYFVIYKKSEENLEVFFH
jgi:hypothetical protein